MRTSVEEKEKIRFAIWEKVIQKLQGETIFKKSNSTKGLFIASQPVNKSGCKYTMFIYEKSIGAKLEFNGNEQRNQELFEKMLFFKKEIENEFRFPLNWLNEGKITRILFSKEIDYTDLRNEEIIIKFLTENILLIQKATERYLDRVY